MSLVSGEKSNFQFILRLLNTNVRIPRDSQPARAPADEEEEMGGGVPGLETAWDTFTNNLAHRSMAKRR